MDKIMNRKYIKQFADLLLSMQEKHPGKTVYVRDEQSSTDDDYFPAVLEKVKVGAELTEGDCLALCSQLYFGRFVWVIDDGKGDETVIE
jgi:hypothetical protein